jgi:hypothetical protein
VLFAPSAPMIFATLASSIIILACLLPVLRLVQIIFLTEYIMICGPLQLLMCLTTNTIYSLLMITLTLCGLFLCELNLTHFLPCQIFLPLSPHSLVAPSKLFSVTMTVSLTTSHLEHFSPLMGWFHECPAPTSLRRTVKPSVLFAP